ncbi:MAG: low molecular weight phosphotyrosine protein phosphatase [Proteobacteria bacterium]|jgi:protein-tyrosine phosphatase|nr:low molecular weight phosphotyrosine protein phosphatase [Pseudomonadota bacterium]
MQKPVSVLFVCIGNICRSPTGEAIFKALVTKNGLSDKIKVDSAGSNDYHVGEAPNKHSTQSASKRGYKLEGRSRQYTEKDFEDFDYILGMDASNEPHLKALAPDGFKTQIISFIDLCPTYKGKFEDVPDPYYGGIDGFDLVLDVVEEGCENLLQKIRKDHNI